jgi:hypothetical protein
MDVAQTLPVAVEPRIAVRMLLILVFAVLLVNIRFNAFRTVSMDRFANFQADSQALVDQKAYEVFTRGHLDPARGFLVKSKTMEVERIAERFPAGAPADGEIYRSQFGLQGALVAMFQSMFRLRPAVTLSICETLMAAATAGVLMLVISGLLRRGGPFVAGVASLAFAFNPIVVQAGRNLYWAIPLIMLPLVMCWRIYEARGAGESALRTAFPVVMGLVFLKCLCGYEYITCLCLGPAVALAAVWASGDFEKPTLFLRHALFLFGAACIGFGVAMIVHFAFVWWAVGDFRAAIDSIMSRAVAHIGATHTAPLVPEKYQHGVVGLVLMIIKYLTLPGVFLGAEVSIGEGSYILLSASFVGMFVFVVLTAFAGCRSLSDWRKFCGPVVVVSLGLLASVSWLVAARGHALHHFHLNSMAFLPLILSFPLALFASRSVRREG